MGFDVMIFCKKIYNINFKRDKCYKFAFVSKQIFKAFSGVKYALDVIFVKIGQQLFY